MNLILMTLLIIGSIILNIILLLMTKKFKDYKFIGRENKCNKKHIGLLYEFWKKQIIIISFGITLSFISIFIDINNKVVLNTFIILSGLYSFIAIVLGIYNYNNFNKGINKLLN